MKILARPAFAIDKLNPYTGLLYMSLQRCNAQVTEMRLGGHSFDRYDVIHVHWPDLVPIDISPMKALLRSSIFLLQVGFARRAGAKLVWTVHNIRPHDSVREWLMSFYWPRFLRMLDGAIFLTEYSRELALSEIPKLASIPHAVIWHGHYRPVLGEPVDRGVARCALGLPANGPMLLYFGQIRPYKNVPSLVRAFIELDWPGATLFVVGASSADGKLEVELRRLANGRPEIHLELSHVPQDRLNQYLAASDLVVLPYRDILNSGALLMALSACRPVLCPARGSLPEVSDAVGSDWVRCYENDLELGELRKALEAGPPAGEPNLSRCEWSVIAEQHVQFFSSICEK